MELAAQGTNPALHIRQATVDDGPQLTALHDDVFGPGRFARTSYRIRETGRSVPELGLVAIMGEKLAGSVHLTPVNIGGAPGALLLGPLVIADAYKGQQTGLSLMLEGIRISERLGYELIILVGDLPYFSRAGFAPVPPGQIALPGPVDPKRLLYREIAPGALKRFRGTALPG